MTALRVVASRVLGMLTRRRQDADLSAEIQMHLDLLAEEHVRRGLSPDEARAAARRAFGGVDQIREAHRDQGGLPFVDALVQDARFGARLLMKDRGFTLVAVMALALGLGVNNAFLTIVHATCIRGLPIDRADRVMFIATRTLQDRRAGLSYSEFEATRVAIAGFEGLAAYTGAPMTIGDPGKAPDRVLGAYISAGAFRLLGEAPMLGREFLPEDDRFGAPAVAVLSSDVWRSRYSGDPSALGRTISVNGVAAILIGVMPDGFRFPNNVELWQPLAQMPGVAEQRRDARLLAAFGRLKEEATMARVQAELEALAARLAATYPDTNRDIQITVVPINAQFNGRVTDRVWLAFLTAGTLVLLIACANVANLLLMRSAARSREVAIRASIGATRRRIVRQLLVESALLALLGGSVGLGLSVVVLRVLSSIIPEKTLPYWMEYTIDGRVLGILALVCLGSVFVFGLVPALQVSRTRGNEVLKDGGRTNRAGFRANRWTAGFLASEFALTLVLLANVGLSIRQFRALQRAELTIDAPPLLTIWLTLPNQKYRTPDARTAFYDSLNERLGAIGNISSATLTSVLPLGGGLPQQLAIAGRPLSAQETPTVRTVTIGPAYFNTLGLPVRRGRSFTDRDGTPGQETAIVNQRFVELYFPNQEPIGALIRLTSPATPDPTSPWVTIVGVSPTIRQRPTPDPDPVVYLPYRTSPPSTAALIVRASSDPTAIAPTIREVVRQLDSDLPLYRIMPMEQAMSESRWNGRVSAAMISGISAIAFLLALVGAYAVTAHAVAQRTQEIGVRMALGAQPSQVRALVLRGAMVAVSIGIALGISATFVFERLFTGAPGTLTDPIVLIPVATVLALVAAAACIVPATRAARVDPASALRYE